MSQQFPPPPPGGMPPQGPPPGPPPGMPPQGPPPGMPPQGPPPSGGSNTKLLVGVAIALVVLLIGVTGGLVWALSGDDDDDSLRTDDDTSSETTDAGDDEASEEETDEPTEVASAETPDPAVISEDPEVATSPATGELLTIGQEADLSQWQVTVTDVNRDANEAIQGANSFNDPPQGVYVLITFDATLKEDTTLGKDGQTPKWRLSWALTTADGVEHSTGMAAVTPAQAGWDVDAMPGETIPWQVVFDVDPATLDGAVLRVWDSDPQSYEEVSAQFEL